ncbi:hypothetical protein GEMRC1_004949 [Eukaryota sp. GEM-RC1]
MAITTISSDPTDRDHFHASIVADIILATLNPKQDIVDLNEFHVRWDQKLKSDDSLLPRFFNEVKGIWITYMRSTAVAAPPANRRDMRHGPPRNRGPQSKKNVPFINDIKMKLDRLTKRENMQRFDNQISSLRRNVNLVNHLRMVILC